MEPSETTGIVFNIQRFTIHDGPGIRTEIFLKGCTLNCQWCSNPESLKPSPETACHPVKCLGRELCGQCLAACQESALRFDMERLSGIDRQACIRCRDCVDICPSGALSVYGKEMTVSDVLQAVQADESYYGDEGGVTFSGGEPFVQNRFLMACLKACQNAGFHTCVESALEIPQDHLAGAVPFIDLLISDLKVMDPDLHKTVTGRSNIRIHDNLRFLASRKIPLIIRIPIIPGVNDTFANTEATARFIRTELNPCVKQVQLLRYRPLGIEKYASLGLDYPMSATDMPDRPEAESHIRELLNILLESGLPAVAGTTTPY